jgi:hypothetical protein
MNACATSSGTGPAVAAGMSSLKYDYLNAFIRVNPRKLAFARQKYD